jgi:N-acetylmuramoyl-L-alanine amidase
MAYNPLNDLDVMAKTVWAEARGEDTVGQQAVAWVIRNRYEHPRWWSRHRDAITDDTIAAVCRDPWQFSCWNPNDPNRSRLDNPKLLEDSAFKAIRQICEMVLRGELPDPTGKSDHYCTTKVARYTNWARGRKPVKVIGNHSFYRLEI